MRVAQKKAAQNTMQKTNKATIRALILQRSSFSALDFDELDAEGELPVLVPFANSSLMTA